MIVPVYVPAARPVVVAETVGVAAPEPPPGATESQDESEAAVQSSVPIPVLAIVMLVPAGEAPPAIPVNVREPGVTLRIGVEATLEPYADNGPSV